MFILLGWNADFSSSKYANYFHFKYALSDSPIFLNHGEIWYLLIPMFFVLYLKKIFFKFMYCVDICYFGIRCSLLTIYRPCNDFPGNFFFAPGSIVFFFQGYYFLCAAACCFLSFFVVYILGICWCLYSFYFLFVSRRFISSSKILRYFIHL